MNVDLPQPDKPTTAMAISLDKREGCRVSIDIFLPETVVVCKPRLSLLARPDVRLASAGLHTCSEISDVVECKRRVSSIA
jgi:hypothetical protein